MSSRASYLPISSCIQPYPVYPGIAGYSWIQLDTTGYGWIWLDMAGYKTLTDEAIEPSNCPPFTPQEVQGGRVHVTVFKQGVERLPRGGRTRQSLLLHDRVGGDAAINASGTV
eukprot:scaffold48561_cov71-Phaeocystis_antarctica.AAC.1